MTDVAQRLRELSITEWGPSGALEMVGHDPSLVAVQHKLLKVAEFQEPVLIAGESGSGKEHLAQALYLLGGRRGKPFVSVSCPQYQEGNLTVSELFGHVKGSFTGAIYDRKGCFETADGGIIFLDEIADLHMSAQVMLLRALAVGEFRPLGSDRNRSVNVRVVAATNRPLYELTVSDAFRHDLFFRLRYFLLEVPPRRRRGDDWRLLIDFYLGKLHHRYGVEKRFSSSALSLLSDYEWPGNVRQLVGVATMGYAMSEGELIEPEDFEAQLEVGGRRSEDVVHELRQRLLAGEEFWKVVYEPFMARDLNRAQVRALIRSGLAESQGNYRKLLDALRIAEKHYQKFMDFLRHHRLKP